jgi:aminomethyltransferase
MASQRVVTALRPAANGLGPRLLRANCAQKAQYTTRALSSHASRPRNVTRQQQQQVRYASSETPKEQLGRTGLYELHSKYGAKFVPFGGYSMPVQYSDLSIVDSHNWTREKASLFDVGHM